MATNIKKAIIPVANEDDLLFPLTRCIPRELLPLGGVPAIERVVSEAIDSKAEEIIFILSSSKKNIINHFQNIDKIPEGNEEFKEKYSSVSFSSLVQKKNTSSGSAIFRAKEQTGEEPFMVSFPENIFFGKRSSLEQLFTVYRTSQKQVIGVRAIKDEEVERSCVVETEKIANRLYKVKKILENPSAEETESRLALAGRYLFTPAIFDHLKNSGGKKPIIDTLNEIIAAGKTIYGHECEGEWFFLGDKESYLNAQRFFSNNQ